MLRHERSAPIWLFSFVDLAFLLLIAFTQAGPEWARTGPPVGQIEMPRLQTPAGPLAGRSDPSGWQLRVHPVLAHEGRRTGESAVAAPLKPASEPRSALPFELVESAGAQPESTRDGAAPTRIDARALAVRLERLRERGAARPILAPHRDSRSEDLLIAVGLLEDAWQGDRAVAVVPGPQVAAGPPPPGSTEAR